MKKFGFIGAGKMASAIVGGMLNSGTVGKSEVGCLGGDDDTAEVLSRNTGISIFGGAKELCENSEVVVLACKPQQLSEAAKSAGGCGKNPLLISILAGTTLEKLRASFPFAGNIVRVMPNMAAQIGMGISCYASEKPLSDWEKNTVDTVLGAIGEFMETEESKLDAVTALSGSGPGYVFEFAAALIEGGKKIGFTEQEAKKLVYSTIAGSAALLERSPLSADELRNAVSSKGGTTLAGLAEFEKSNFRKMVADCLEAAKNRSSQLAKM